MPASACAPVPERRERESDVKQIDKVNADVITGGFPCQDISLAGKQAGLSGAKSKLWWEFARILDTSRPRWVIVENVAALLSSNNGHDMGAILGALGEIGYGFAYRVLDAQFFGVPQRRRRVFIVGCLGDTRRASQVLLEPEGGCWDPPARGEAGPVAAALTRSGLGGGGPDDNLAQANHLIASTLTSGGASQLDDNALGQLVPQTFDWQVAGSERTWIHDAPGGPSRSLTRSKTLAVAFHVTQDPITSTERFPTLPTGSTGGSATLGISDQLGVRKLMPIECERLQGFPDDWTDGHADTTRYRMLGNAVAVPVVEWIARRLMEADR